MAGNWIKRAFQWRDDRNEIAKLEYSIEDIRGAFARDIQAAKAKSSPQDVYNLEQDEFQETLPYYDMISVIRSRQLFDAAVRLGIPIPRRTEDSIYWQYSRTLGKHQLSDEGIHYLRREIAHERELRQKPILSWGALAVSFVGLAISIIALTKE